MNTHKLSDQQKTILKAMEAWDGIRCPLYHLRQVLGFDNNNSNQASLSRSIKRLEKKGLIKRYFRQKLYMLTDQVPEKLRPKIDQYYAYREKIAKFRHDRPKPNKRIFP